MSKRRWSLLIALALIAPLGWSASPGAWLRVEYGNLLDRRKLTHSGEPVAVVLERLAAHPDDALSRRLLDPILEPYAFVLPDAVDALAPPHDPPYVEIGGLFEPGGEEPAWVELCRARRYLIESDGEGKLRAFLPAPSIESQAENDALPAVDGPKTAEEAWRAAWPVVRHVAAAERRRLALVRGGAPPPLEFEVRAYRHLASRSAFVVGEAPWIARVEDTGPPPGSRPLDLDALRSILERGLTIEGARLDASGRVRWFTSEADEKPKVLGRPPQLSDLAVAYRAVARGGVGEPYMSLDRAAAPHVAEVNYGGRLRDTALGMVSLLSDVRFKTFSVGIDLLGLGDARAATARAVPGFKTHLERFAADPSASTVLNQQTRFWFYPDDVDLTLSAEGDVLAFRRARMAAASERVQDASSAAAKDPAWTRDTVTFLNTSHEALARAFPEIASLDETVRYLAIFTWLEGARARGLAVPDLDVLLAVPLPALPTPRRFPQLLSYDVLPSAGTANGVVDVYDRTAVGAALDRLEPRNGKPLPAPRRLHRALAQLDRRVPDQAALAEELAPLASSVDTTALDLASYRAERLLMHARVLATLPQPARSSVDARKKEAPGTRVFSVGIGGVDLGMGAVFARASSKAEKLAPGSKPAPAPSSAAPASPTPATPAAAASDPPSLPETVLPDHGLGAPSSRAVASLEDGRGRVESRARPGTLVRKGTWKVEGGRSVGWEEARYGVEGTELRTRRRISEPDLATPAYERFEDGRFLAYRFARQGSLLRAESAMRTLPDRAFVDAGQAGAGEGSLPEGLVVLELSDPASASVEAVPNEPAALRVRVRAAPSRDLTANVPRGLLQRLVLGREVDLVPERPLAAFTPASQVLATAKTLMVLERPDESEPPWSRLFAPRPGEEDAARLARALTVWWASDPPSSGAVAVVGTSPSASPARWVAAPRLGPSVAPVLVVSADAPGVLGRKLRALAEDPAMKGRFVAVTSTGGGVRGDLPASLLAGGVLAGLGVDEAGPLDPAGAARRAEAWAKAAREATASGKRPEEIPGPFTWYY